MTHFVWVIDWIKYGQIFPCLFHQITGFYCPGCGGTRAMRALLQGNFLKSFCYHPFVLYAAMVMAIEMGYLAVEVGGRFLKKRQGVLEEGEWKRKVKSDFQRRYARWVAAAVWIVGMNWVVKNGFLLMGVDLLGCLEG